MSLSLFTWDFFLLDRVGRKVEAKDAARGALKSPWWTLGCTYQVRACSLCFHLFLVSYVFTFELLLLVVFSTPRLSYLIGFNYIQEVATIAQWDDEQIEFIKEKVSEEGKRDDLQKGKEPAQVLKILKRLSLLFMLFTRHYFHFLWHIFI